MATALPTRFARAMARLGPFESAPHLAVAVSGGADSMALALLARDWLQARRGRLTALIIDHALRPESKAEARLAVRRLKALGIEALILTRTGPLPKSGLQDAARAARYALLRDWCRGAGVLHLLTGHTRGDQLETHLMRRARNATGPGAAGMSARHLFPEVRLLRPLLGMDRADLEALLDVAEVAWIEDPSNRNETFERVRVRARLAADPALAARAAEDQAAAAEARIALETAVNAGLAACIQVHPEGYAVVDQGAFRDLEDAARGPLLARLALCIGGAGHAPAPAKAAGLAARLADGTAFRGASLGRCTFASQAAGWLVCRDGRGLPGALAAVSQDSWDGRFQVTVPDGLRKGVVLAPLGAAGWRQLDKATRRAWGPPPAAARTLPALFRGSELVTAPGQGGLEIRFRPQNTLDFEGFCIA